MAHVIPFLISYHIHVYTVIWLKPKVINLYVSLLIIRELFRERALRKRRCWRGGKKEKTFATVRSVEASNQTEHTTAGEEGGAAGGG